MPRHGAILLLLCLPALLGVATACDTKRADGRLRELETIEPPPRGEAYVTARRVAGLDLPASPRALVLNGDALYALCDTAGLFTFDVSDPPRPRLVHRLRAGMPGATGARPQHHFYEAMLDGDRLIVLDRHHGLLRLDVSDPMAPRPDALIAIPGGQLTHVVRRAEHYLVSAAVEGLWQVPVGFSAEDAPRRILPSYDHMKQSNVLDDRWLIVADNYDGGIRVHNLRGDVVRPSAVYMAGSFCDAFELFGPMAVVANRARGLLFLDLTRPRRPRLHARMRPTGWVTCLEPMGGERLLVGNSVGSIDLLDLRDPFAAQWLGRFHTRFWVDCIAVRGDHVFAGLNVPFFRARERQPPRLIVLELTERR